MSDNHLTHTQPLTVTDTPTTTQARYNIHIHTAASTIRVPTNLQKYKTRRRVSAESVLNSV